MKLKRAAAMSSCNRKGGAPGLATMNGGRQGCPGSVKCGACEELLDFGDDSPLGSQ